MVKVFGGGEGEGAEFAYYAVALTVSFSFTIPLLHPMASCNLISVMFAHLQPKVLKLYFNDDATLY